MPLLDSISTLGKTPKRLAPYICGFAFYWAWLMLSFYVASPFSESTKDAPSFTNLAWFSSAAGHVIALLAFATKPCFFNSIIRKRIQGYMSGTAVALGSLAGSTGFVLSDYGLAWVIVSIIGFLIAGGASAFLVVAWGMRFVGFLRDEICFVNACALILAGGIHFLLSSINSTTMIVVVIALPLLSGIILSQTVHSSDDAPSTSGPLRQGFVIKKSWRIAIPFAACAVYALCGEILRNASMQTIGITEMGLYYDFGLIVGSAAVMIENILPWKKPGIQRSELEALRPIFVVMAIAFMITVIFDMPYYVAYLCFAVGFAGLRIHAWLFCYSIIGKFALNPLRVIAIMLASFALGPLIASPAMHAIMLDSALWGKTALAMICIMFFIVIEIADGTRYETIWGLVERTTSLAATLPGDFSYVAKTYRLTARESQVAELLAQGRSLPYIENALGISPSTAQTHQRHIYEKMKVHSRQDFLDLVHKTLSMESSEM